MKVDARNVSGPVRTAIQTLGWQICDDDVSPADVVLKEVQDRVEIRLRPSLNPDDVAFLPLNREELKFRVELARQLETRLANRLHDLRSPLNAIQGYADMLLECTQGDANRFASNICTASQILINHLEAFQKEGV